MTAQPALIWDLDGTLIDSYQMIVPSLRIFYAARGLLLTDEEIRTAVLRASVREFALGVRERTGISLEAGMEDYLRIRNELEREIRPMPHAARTLRTLADRGVLHFVFTHRGSSTVQLLERVGLADCFREILTAESGFPRKPDPAGVRYLMERHGLDPARTRYVGDRQLDMDCACQAGIGGILLRTPDSPDFPVADTVTVVNDLSDILPMYPEAVLSAV